MTHKRARTSCGILGLVLILAGCSSTPTPKPGPPRAPLLGPDPGRVAVAVAQAHLGAPYRYGGAGPHGFDCSGLVHYSYRRAGMRVPRTTHAQLRTARRIPLSQVRPGDLLFFKVAPPKISHVGMYAGHGRFIHAPSRGKRVSYAELDNPYWRSHLVTAGRFYSP